MAKQGMARPEHTHTKPRNEYGPVPEIQGKHGKKSQQEESADAAYYPAIDNELALDNMENDFPAADLNAR